MNAMLQMLPGNTLWDTYCPPPPPLKSTGEKEAIHYQRIKLQSNLLGRNPWPRFVQVSLPSFHNYVFFLRIYRFLYIEYEFSCCHFKKPTVFRNSRSKIDVFHKETSSYLEQDACRGVHSACRREVNRHKLDICVLRFRQGRIQAFSYVGQNFLVLKWGGGLD